MPLWRRNLNSKQRRNSRKPKFQPTAVEVIKKLPECPSCESSENVKPLDEWMKK